MGATWVGIKPCGCVTAAVSCRQSRRGLAEGIGEMVLNGLRLEMRTGEVSLTACQCKPMAVPFCRALDFGEAAMQPGSGPAGA